MGWKQAALSLGDFLLCFILYWSFSVIIHEYIHLEVLRYFGGDGYIKLGFISAYVQFTTPPTQPFIVALSGGIGLAILYSILAYRNWANFDPEEYSSLLPIISAQLFYGFFEAFFIYTMPLSQFADISQVIFLIGMLIGLVPAIWIMGKQLMAKLDEG
jgi:hypothetical protein